MEKLGRRGFLGALIGGAAFALDPERALWVRGAKTFSVPAAIKPVRVEWIGFDEGMEERYFRPAAEAIHLRMLGEYNARIEALTVRAGR